MKIEFVIAGPIQGKNQARGIDWKNRRVFVNGDMRKWQRKVAVAAWAAAVRAGWPEPFAVSRASFTVERRNISGDADRGCEYLADALQVTRWPTPRGESALPGPVGLVGNDRDLWNAGSPPSVQDDLGPRIRVTVTLEALRAPYEAEALRKRWFENEVKRAAKKAGKAVKRAEVRDAAAHRSAFLLC